MNGDYEFQAFISYSHTDQAWAARLGESLTQNQVKVFLDRDSLRAGSRWEDQLQAKLRDSRHLVFLWSGAVADDPGGWPLRELSEFQGIVSASGAPDRLIIFVLLEGDPRAYRSSQLVTLIRDANAYQHGAHAVPDQLWGRLVSEVVEGVRYDDPSLVVPILLLTTTKELMARMQLGKPPELPFRDVLRDLRIGNRRLAAELYGSTRSEWRPFGGTLTIEQILDQVRDDINADIRAHGGTPIRWEYLNGFWSDDPVLIDRDARRLADGSAIVVIDPLSFFDEVVIRRYANDLEPAMANQDAVFLVLSPFVWPAEADVVRKVVGTMAKRIYRHFYDPLELVGGRHARLGLNVGNEAEFKAWLLNAVASRVSTPVQATTPYMDFGS
jgi:hypothetical protein